MIAIGHLPRKYHAVLFMNDEYVIAEVYRRQFSLWVFHVYQYRYRERFRREDFDYGARSYILLGYVARNAYLNCLADRSGLLKKELSVHIKNLK